MLNRVYALLVGNRDEDGRRELDEQLWAPEGGWERQERQFWTRLDAEVSDGAAG